jgi:uncharacterized membrane protein YfhO
LTVSVDAARSSVLVISDVPGAIGAWSAEVDGRAALLWRANFAYLAIPIEPGGHEVRLSYRPPGLRTAVTLMGLALAACAVALWSPRLVRSPSSG